MAMDQAMLEYAAATQQVLLRIYQWSKPTISLGYFQAYEEIAKYPELQSLDCVRRVTGGGAILHDREITYSLAVPGDLQHKGHNEQLYRTVHRAVAGWLQSLHFDVRHWEDANQAPTIAYTGIDSFWCFERRSDVDLVVDNRKVLGSAQRRSTLGLLQHGSLLVEASVWKPELQGLVLQAPDGMDEDSKRYLTPTNLSDIIGCALGCALGCDWTRRHADEVVCNRAIAIDTERFSTPGWTQSKNRRTY